MQLPDLINGIFETGIGVLGLKNIQAIRRDKTIRGVHWGVTAWAGLWGYWNLYYYPHLDQWLSFSGGMMITACNSVWLGYAFYYWRKSQYVKGPSTTTLLIDPFPR